MYTDLTFFQRIALKQLERGGRLTRSGTIILKPSLKNPEKKPCSQRKFGYVDPMSLAQGGELLYQSRNLCSQTYARVQIHFPRLVLFVFFFVFFFYQWLLYYEWSDVFYFFIFSFGLNTYCTVELHWYVTFYYAFKSSFWKHTRW